MDVTLLDRFKGTVDMRKESSIWRGYATFYFRLALGVGFLSAVADRFGVWGPPGASLVAWGNFHDFLAYAAKLNPWFPAGWAPTVGWIATLCEVALGIGLIVGFRTRMAALLSGLLTLAFGLGMAFGLGIKAPLNYSVFAISAGAFLLACTEVYPWSFDALLDGKKTRTSTPPIRNQIKQFPQQG